MTLSPTFPRPPCTRRTRAPARAALACMTWLLASPALASEPAQAPAAAPTRAAVAVPAAPAQRATPPERAPAGATARRPEKSERAAPAPARLAREDPPPGEDPAPADPLDLLRQRLADRLSTVPASTAGSPFDVRISTRSTLPAAAPARTAARPAGSGRPARVSQGPGAGAVRWAYEGEAGPLAWGSLKPEYTLCKSGERQSPIDIRGGLAVNLDPVRFDYQPTQFAVLDNGHTVQVNVVPGNTIEVNGRRFELQQFHFHRPAEERIDGRQFEMSLHLVHRDAQGRLAVVALLFDEGPPNALVQEVWNNLPLERGEAVPAREPIDLGALLPNDRRYYTYMGSLTTPPCSEGVQWIVMRAPQSLTAEQIGIFARIYPMNARPVQAAAGRRILQSE